MEMLATFGIRFLKHMNPIGAAIDMISNIGDEIGMWFAYNMVYVPFQMFVYFVNYVLQKIANYGVMGGSTTDRGLNGFIKYIDSNTNFVNFATFDGTLITVMQAFGFVVVFICLFFFFIQFLRNPEKSQQTLWDTVIRTVIAVALIGAGGKIILYFSGIAATLCSLCVRSSNGFLCADNFFNVVLPPENVTFDPAYGMGKLEGNVSFTVLGISIPVDTAFAITMFSSLFGLLLAWPLLKNFFRLVLEMIERYLVFVVMGICFPAAISTITLRETENVFKSYMRMMFGNIFLLVVGGLLCWSSANVIMSIIPSTITSDGTSVIGGVIGYIYILGFLRVAQRIDAYVSALGVNVGQTVGGLADSLGGAVRGLGNMIRSANNTRKSVGQGMQALGARSGNAGLFKAGQILGSSLRNPPALSAATQGKMFAAAVTQADRTASVAAPTAWGNIAQASASPLHSKDMMDHMDQSSRAAGIEYGTGLSGVHDVKWGANGAIDFKAMDGDGNMHNYSLSAKDDGLSKAVGEGIYLNSTDHLEKGESFSGSNNSVLAAVGAVGLEDRVGSLVASADTADVTANGAVRLSNSQDGSVVGTLANGKYFNNEALGDSNGNVKKEYEGSIMKSLATRMPGYEPRGGIKYDKDSGKHYVELANTSSNSNQLQRVDVHIMGNDVKGGNYDKRWAVNTRSSSSGQNVKLLFETKNDAERV